jgi:hypothetical protein
MRDILCWKIIKSYNQAKLMSTAAKKFLVILELNNVLLYLNDPKSKIIGNPANRIQVPYHDQYKNLSLSYRRGKP